MTIHAEYPTPKGVGVPQRLRNALAKSDGKGCQCFALYSGECSCDADWRSKDEVLIDWIWRHPGCDVASLIDTYIREYKETK